MILIKSKIKNVEIKEAGSFKDKNNKDIAYNEKIIVTVSEETEKDVMLTNGKVLKTIGIEDLQIIKKFKDDELPLLEKQYSDLLKRKNQDITLEVKLDNNKIFNLIGFS